MNRTCTVCPYVPFRIKSRHSLCWPSGEAASSPKSASTETNPPISALARAAEKALGDGENEGSYVRPTQLAAPPSPAPFQALLQLYPSRSERNPARR